MEAIMAKTVPIAVFCMVLLGLTGMNAGAQQQKELSFPFMGGGVSEKEKLQKEIMASIDQEKKLIAANKAVQDQISQTMEQIRVISTKMQPLRDQIAKNNVQLQLLRNQMRSDENRLQQMAIKK
jgi:septal ring factor EnvC (AmiA/AmiB activator)